MSNATFKKIMVMTVPGDITADALKKSLGQLVEEVKNGSVTDIIVDVSALSEDDKHLKNVGKATGEWARKEIDPKLKAYKIKKVAFVSPSGNYHGRDKSALDGEGPVLGPDAPAKHYFTDHAAAINWLNARS